MKFFASIVWGNEARLKNELANSLKTASVESQLVSERVSQKTSVFVRFAYVGFYIGVEAFALWAHSIRVVLGVIHPRALLYFFGDRRLDSFLMTLLGLCVESSVQFTYIFDQSLSMSLLFHDVLHHHVLSRVFFIS
jgi:hypothetical protein